MILLIHTATRHSYPLTQSHRSQSHRHKAHTTHTHTYAIIETIATQLTPIYYYYYYQTSTNILGNTRTHSHSLKHTQTHVSSNRQQACACLSVTICVCECEYEIISMAFINVSSFIYRHNKRHKKLSPFCVCLTRSLHVVVVVFLIRFTIFAVRARCSTLHDRSLSMCTHNSNASCTFSFVVECYRSRQNVCAPVYVCVCRDRNFIFWV